MRRDLFLARCLRRSSRRDDDTRAECVACGRPLDPRSDEPCPDCHKTGTKRAYKTLVAATDICGSVSARKAGGRTGRSAQVLLDSKRTYHAAVQSLVRDLCATRRQPNWWLVLASRPVAWRLLADLGRAASTGIDATYFRSRRFRAGSPPVSSCDFGPPPPGKQREGRYTEGKRSVLYLARTPELAALESPGDPERPEVYIQEFRIVSHALKAVELNSDLEMRAPAIQYLLVESEYLPNECECVPNPYRATQFLAFLCRLRGIRAVEYPSVRGGYRQDPRAVNLAVLGSAVDAVRVMARGSPSDSSARKEAAFHSRADGATGVLLGGSGDTIPIPGLGEVLRPPNPIPCRVRSALRPPTAAANLATAR